MVRWIRQKPAKLSGVRIKITPGIRFETCATRADRHASAELRLRHRNAGIATRPAASVVPLTTSRCRIAPASRASDRWVAHHRRSTRRASPQVQARSKALPHCSRSRRRSRGCRRRTNNMLSIRGHRGNTPAMLANLCLQQYRQLRLHVFGVVPEHAGVEWHVLDLESVTKRVHVEETRMFLVDAPRNPPLHGRIYTAASMMRTIGKSAFAPSTRSVTNSC